VRVVDYGKPGVRTTWLLTWRGRRRRAFDTVQWLVPIVFEIDSTSRWGTPKFKSPGVSESTSWRVRVRFTSRLGSSMAVISNEQWLKCSNDANKSFCHSRMETSGIGKDRVLQCFAFSLGDETGRRHEVYVLWIEDKSGCHGGERWKWSPLFPLV
jgi:hypothetical protein